MKLIRLIACLLVFLTPAALAYDWPWSEQDVEQMAYCKGLVAGGLSSRFTAGHQRRDLWLAWNYLVRTGGVGEDAATRMFEEGRLVFASATDAETASNRLREVKGDCGLGRSGWQISGW